VKSRAADSASEAAAMTFLARLFASEIDAELLAALRVPGLKAGLAAFDPGVEAALDADWGPKEYEEAATEFCELFVLPNGVAPIASAWLPGDDPNRAAALASVTHALREQGGLELPVSLARLPQDHVSVVLALGSWMLSEVEARQDSETLLEAVFLPWAPRFARALEERSRHPIYAASARATLALCDRDGTR
jgi:TorA maturation chaperone TorD